MSVGFGFSVGDFIATLELVATVTDALRESGEASNRYRELVRQLYTLETVLLRVKRLELDESQHAEYVALQQAASQCQRTIDDFWKKIQKYQAPLSSGGTSSKLKESWMKIRWAVCRTEDVNTFKADLVGHTESIQLLLTTIQMSRTNILEKKTNDRHLSLSGKIQMAYFECMKRLSAVAQTASSGIEQGKQLLTTTSKILQVNVQVFQIVLNIQNIITRIPAQVERQQPVYLVDALGKCSPFHLEFIRSSEAFTAVIQANFSKTGQARAKVRRGEFVIQNSLTGRDIDIFGDWEHCFYPGQKVEMSLIFQRRWQAGTSCPSCGMICAGSVETNVECSNCEITFRRVITVADEKSLKPFSKKAYPQVGNRRDSGYSFTAVNEIPETAVAIKNRVNSDSFFEPDQSNTVLVECPSAKKKRKREYSHDGELGLELQQENIRRVRVQTVSRGMTQKFKALFGYFEEGGRPEPAFCCGFRTSNNETCLIVEFEESKSGALCETINDQKFKQGGLFKTELVEAENQAIDEDDSLQITWMEEDEVQMYLRFHKASDRDVIWDFIASAGAISETIVEDPITPTSHKKRMRMSAFPVYLTDLNPTSTPTDLAPGTQMYPLFPDLNLSPEQYHVDQNSVLFRKNSIQAEPFSIRKPDELSTRLPNSLAVMADIDDTVAMKRARNTLAARKSRQRKMHKFDELEGRIAKTEAERDYWKQIALGHVHAMEIDQEESLDLRDTLSSWVKGTNEGNQDNLKP